MMQRRISPTFSMLALGLTFGLLATPAALAASPDTAPAELTQMLADIQAASNQEALEQVLAFYSDDFTSSNGFDRQSLEETLKAFWQEYSSLDYDIELLDWTATDGGYTIETVTHVTGVSVLPSRRLALEAEVRSQQQIQAGQITSQEVLTQRSQLTAGQNPPTLTVYLPDQLTAGESYEFDAIVNEPLEGRSLLGVAVDEGATAVDFLKPRPLSLDVLTAGGLYKIGQAPDGADTRWVSAVIVREDGMVIETRQVSVAADQ